MTQQQHTKFIQLIQSKHPHVFAVKLLLNGQPRYLGRLDLAGLGTFYCKRKEKHLYRIMNAFGVNLELLQRSDIQFKWIIIDFQGQQLVTSRMYFLYHGSVKNHKKAGFEAQCFLKLDLWGREKADAFESTLFKQEELFDLKELANVG